ncbi:hypothetical protein SNEBB_005926 [Seison nebaliae]|nr:hypothetical protein SNEBB_005926 [Seison nebaliae]
MTENAFPPERGSDYAAGLDLRAAYSDVIPARGAGKLIKTDLAIELPVGCYGRIAPRSGLAYKNSIDVGGGVIDRDYRGNVGVILYNHHPTQDFKVNRGDRIAQLILERCYENVQLVESEKPLEKTTRGEKGFGSTGIKNEFLQDVVYDEVVYDTTSSIPINQQNCLVNYLNILMKTFQQCF